jgi:competence protein ComEC
VIETILSKIKEELASEYTQLSFWHFISFLFGCVCFFDNSDLLTISQAGIILITLYVCSIIFKNQIITQFIILLSFFFILGFTAGIIKKYRISNTAIPNNLFGTIQGTIEQITKTPTGTRVVLRNVSVSNHNQKKSDAVNIDGVIRINIKDKYFTKLEIGDHISIKACLMPPPTEIIPNGYDFSFYASLNNINAVGFATSEPKIIQKNDNYLGNIRKKIYQRLTSSLSSIPANFIAALVIGDSQGLDKATMTNMRLAGISHILCVSGLHLSLVTLICFKFFRFSLNASDYLAHKINIKLVSGILSIIFSYGYLKLSGSQVSATRAFIMCALATIAVISQRSYSPMRAVGIASFIILAVNPDYSLHPSFQLSFLAVLSLIGGYSFYNTGSKTPQNWLAKFKTNLLANFYSSMFVGFTTGPIVIYHFHIYSNYSALANLIAIPITTFILMPCAFVFLFLALFNADIYVLKFMSYFIDIIVKSADFVANLKYNTMYVGNISGMSLSVYIFGFFWLIIWKSKLKYAGIIIICCSILMMFNKTKPDLILDIKKVAIGLKNKQGQLEIYSDKKFSAFSKEYWSLWFGQKDVISHQLDQSRSNLSFKTNQNKMIDIIFDDLDCQTTTDLVINYSEKRCIGSNNILNIPQDKKFLFVFCDQVKCNFKFYD